MRRWKLRGNLRETRLRGFWRNMIGTEVLNARGSAVDFLRETLPTSMFARPIIKHTRVSPLQAPCGEKEAGGINLATVGPGTLAAASRCTKPSIVKH